MCDMEDDPSNKGSPRYAEVQAETYADAIELIKKRYEGCRPRRFTEFELKFEDPVGSFCPKVIFDFARMFEDVDYSEDEENGCSMKDGECPWECNGPYPEPIPLIPNPSKAEQCQMKRV